MISVDLGYRHHANSKCTTKTLPLSPSLKNVMHTVTYRKCPYVDPASKSPERSGKVKGNRWRSCDLLQEQEQH